MSHLHFLVMLLQLLLLLLLLVELLLVVLHHLVVHLLHLLLREGRWRREEVAHRVFLRLRSQGRDAIAPENKYACAFYCAAGSL